MWGCQGRRAGFVLRLGRQVSTTSLDIAIWSTTRDEADATLAEILRDEPEFEGELWVETIEFEYCLN